MRYIIILLISIVGQCAWCRGCESEPAISAIVMPEYLASAREAVMKSWYVVDLMRKIQIDPACRGTFLRDVIPHFISISSSIGRVEASCHLCPISSLRLRHEVTDLGDRLCGLTEAFKVVCSKGTRDGELILQQLLNQSQDAMRRVLVRLTATPLACGQAFHLSTLTITKMQN